MGKISNGAAIAIIAVVAIVVIFLGWKYVFGKPNDATQANIQRSQEIEKQYEAKAANGGLQPAAAPPGAPAKAAQGSSGMAQVMQQLNKK